MPLRSLLEPTPETVNDLVLAAEERYWDAYELAVQGRAFAAIYVAGFTAEMLLKVAGFRFDGAAPGDAIQPRLGPARTYPAILAELRTRTDRAYETWWISLRYRVSGPVSTTVRAEMLPLLEDVDWMLKNHSSLWS